MAQYIDKDALVAEIEKLKLCTMDEHMNYYSTEAQGEYNALFKLKSLLDTLEVKEEDLAKEFDIKDVVHCTIDFPLIGCDFPNIYPNYKELKEYCDRKGIKDNDKVKLIIIKDM